MRESNTRELAKIIVDGVICVIAMFCIIGVVVALATFVQHFFVPHAP